MVHMYSHTEPKPPPIYAAIAFFISLSPFLGLRNLKRNLEKLKRFCHVRLSVCPCVVGAQIGDVYLCNSCVTFLRNKNF